MKAGTRWRLWKPTEVGNTHPQSLRHSPNLLGCVTRWQCHRPLSSMEWLNGYEPDLAFTRQLASDYCAEAVYYIPPKPQPNKGSWKHDPLWSMDEEKAIPLTSLRLWMQGLPTCSKGQTRAARQSKEVHSCGFMERRWRATVYYDPDKNRIYVLQPRYESECGIELDATPLGEYLYLKLELQDEGSVPPEPVVPDHVPVHQPPQQLSARRSVRERHIPHTMETESTWGNVSPLWLILSPPNKDFWLEAIEKVMTSLQEPPQNQKPVGSKWVFKTKIDANGHVEWYKAWLVAQGFLQKFGRLWWNLLPCGEVGIRSCSPCTVSSAGPEAASDRCHYSFSERRARGGSLHETAWRICHSWQRASCLQVEEKHL